MLTDSVSFFIPAAFAFLLLALTLALIHLARSRNINDRIVAMDLISTITMGFIMVYGVLVKRSLYFDVAIVISLIAFVGTVAVSTYLKQRQS